MACSSETGESREGSGRSGCAPTDGGERGPAHSEQEALLFLVALRSLRRALLSYERHLYITKAGKRTGSFILPTHVVLRIKPHFKGILCMLTKCYTAERALDPICSFQ